MKKSSLSEKKGKRKGKGKGGSKPDAVQKNSQSEQTAGQNLNKNAEQVTENVVEGCNKTNTKQVEQTLNRKTTEGSAEKVCVGTGNSKIKSKDIPTPTDEEEMISPTDEEGKKSSKMKKRLDLRHNRKQAKGSSDSDETNDKIVIEEQNFSDSSEETGETSSFVLTEALLLELNSLQETIAQNRCGDQLLHRKCDIIVVALPVNITYVCLQERFAQQEKLNLERNQQDMTSASITRHEFYQAFEQMLKNELNAVVLGVEEIIQKAVPKAVTNAFQGFIGDEAVNHLLNADVEAIVSRNVQQQIQTSGKQAIKDAFSSSLKDSVIPAFEMSCKTLSTQVVAEFNNRISELKDAAQQKVESAHSPLAYDLKESLKAASSMCQTLSGEIAVGQRNIMAVAAASLSPDFTEKVEAKRALISVGAGNYRTFPNDATPSGGGGRGVGYQGNISSGSFDHQMQPRAGPAYSGYGRPSYGFGGPNANAGYGSANAGYGCGSNSGYTGGQSPGYGLSVGYGSNVSAPNQSATGASGYGYGYDTNPGEYRAAAGPFGPGDATSGDPGGGYNWPTGYSSSAWRRSDS